VTCTRFDSNEACPSSQANRLFLLFPCHMGNPKCASVIPPQILHACIHDSLQSLKKEERARRFLGYFHLLTRSKDSTCMHHSNGTFLFPTFNNSESEGTINVHNLMLQQKLLRF
jgi:hypothetical protein